jgi:hypothetical protein
LREHLFDGESLLTLVSLNKADPRSSWSCGNASPALCDPHEWKDCKMQPQNRPATRAQTKQRARELRAELKSNGEDISHAQSLERVAQQLGFRDWNTASALLSNVPELPFHVGDEVSGVYLKQKFTGGVLAVRNLNDGNAFDLTIHFDEPVDVVSWESFSSFRQRVTVKVNAQGVSWAKTSDGEPHIRVTPISSQIV